MREYEGIQTLLSASRTRIRQHQRTHPLWLAHTHIELRHMTNENSIRERESGPEYFCAKARQVTMLGM